MNRNTYPVRWLRGLLCLALVMTTYFATTDPQHLVVTLALYDKLQHLLTFYVLILLADFAWPHRSLDSGKIAFILGYGMMLEVIQYYLPYREFSLLDFVADGAGVALYAVMVPLLQRLPWLRQRWLYRSLQAGSRARP